MKQAEKRRVEAEHEAEERRVAAEKAAKKRKRIITIVAPTVCVCIAVVAFLTQWLIPQKKYDEAMSLIDSGDYDAAYAMLEELGKSEEITASKYERAMDKFDTGDYDSAYVLLEEIGNNEAVAASRYDRAVECIAAQDYETAWELLDGMEYKDSEEKQKSIKPQYYKALLMKAAVGDTVFFGSYEQDNDTSNGKENIEWLVLAKEDDRLLVISQYALDCQQYDMSETPWITWESCTLRKWLNEDFLNVAFSDEEKAMIRMVTVPPDMNYFSNRDSGSTIQDRVFLLSTAEANRYFKSNEERMCVPTAYTKANGADTSSDYTKGGAVTGWWWLRSPNTKWDWNNGTYVGNDGGVRSYGDYVDRDVRGCVRPALWIDFSE